MFTIFVYYSAGYVYFLESVQNHLAQLNLLLAQQRTGSASLSSPPASEANSHPSPDGLLGEDAPDGGGEMPGRRSRHSSGSEGGVAALESDNSLCVVS